jgi:hypothetical protein
MYLVTGLLHIWEIDGSTREHRLLVPVSAPISRDIVLLAEIARTQLRQRGLAEPNGWMGVVDEGDSYRLEWRGLERTIILKPGILKPGEQTGEMIMLDRENSWYRRLALRHKAEGGLIFNLYASLFAVLMLSLSAIGLYMGFASKTHRTAALRSSACGILAFILALWWH